MKTLIVEPQAPRVAKVAEFSDRGEAIYAIMVTGQAIERAHMAKVSILSFLAQTYPNRYLVIINDGPYHFDLRGIPAGRVIQRQVPGRHRLGTLRNLAFECTPKDAILVQWDDDDWHAPPLLAAQFRFLRRHRLDGCALARQVKYAIGQNSAWEHTLPPDYNGFAGTIMIRRKEDIRYPAWRRHEDSRFWLAYLTKYRVRRWNNPAHYYIRFIHPHSTSTHFRLSERIPDAWLVSDQTDLVLRRVLPAYRIPHGAISRRLLDRRTRIVSA